MNRLAALLAVPLILVNASAIWGQTGWAVEHITDPSWSTEVAWTVAVLFAVSLESIGVFLSAMAHAALMADQSAGLTRAASYAVGLLVGALNFWHWGGGQVTEAAIAFGALSAISPWLWAVYSRYRNRDRLAALGMVDKRAVKLSTARKFWHPANSLRVVRFAVWRGIVDPDVAVAQWEANRPAKTAKDVVDSLPPDWIPAEIVDEDQPADDEPADPLRSELWDRYSEPSIESNTRTAVAAATGRSLVNEAIDQAKTADQPRRPGRQPAKSDDQMIDFYGEILRQLRRENKLTRWRVEQATGAGRYQAERLIDLVNAEVKP